MRRVLSKEVPVRPGELITVLTNPVPTQGAGVATFTTILFEGVYRYMVKGSGLAPITTPADVKRYSRSPNQNIMAPEMDLDSDFSDIPAGAKRTPYILESLSTSAVTIAAPGGEATIEIPVSSSFDFFCRRFLVEYDFDIGVTGDLLVKFRDGSGYALDSDYLPIDQVFDAPLAKYWCIRHGVSIFADFALRNGSGAGNVNLNSVQVIGVRQKGI
jgi:hypothetical protein